MLSPCPTLRDLLLCLGTFGCLLTYTRALTVRLVFSNHLDVGFNIQGDSAPGTDLNVINKYFDKYFHVAASTAQQLKEHGGDVQYSWMTHSWLVSLYLDCPTGMGLQCPNATSKAAFEAAVKQGDIHWHAMPFNTQVEMFDPGLLKAAVQLAHDLDAKFGLAPKRTMSQRDVPGLTRAAIPILSKAGVKADEESGTELLAFWHAGGYSGVPVDTGKECVTVEGFDHVLCNAWRQDNAGPHSVQEVQDIFNLTQHSFPGAKVLASSFDTYVAELSKALPQLKLPEVTQEIGDTWVYGVASDARKMKEYRALLRLRHRLEAQHGDSPHFRNFSRLLMKIPEHTWGLDIKTNLGDFKNWSNADFQRQLESRDARYEMTVAQWKRQRKYMAWALEALHPLSDQLQQSPEAMWQGHMGTDELSCDAVQLMSSPNDGKSQSSPLITVASPHWTIELNASTGSFTRLQAHASSGAAGPNWADDSSAFGVTQYSTYTERDFDVIWDTYSFGPDAQWFVSDFGKPNVSQGHPRRAELLPQIVASSSSQDDRGFRVVTRSEFPGWVVQEAGAPEAVITELRSDVSSPELHLDITWVNKTPTRLPEAMWVRFAPSLRAVDPKSWRMHKLGQLISPLEVMLNGSQAQHAVGLEGVQVLSQDHSQRLSIRSLDVKLVSPGTPTPFPTVRQQPDMSAGMSFNLANNVWGTNYVMWQPYEARDANMKFRFTIEASRVEELPQRAWQVTWQDGHIEVS
ncbi:hypothetical protein WJX73_010911 [Symbiochloris irregularis]|uniref:Glycoside hydrolase family 38 N-terminal domain-containing protein n=1 Tax=Symbiochloris irregularis TaxID=706552 RepID=A0AAW1NXG6_9CHLO